MVVRRLLSPLLKSRYTIFDVCKMFISILAHALNSQPPSLDIMSSKINTTQNELNLYSGYGR
jgi:hypothetical protein